MAELTPNIVRAGIPEIDDCPILTRLKAFLVDQGVQAMIEHTFRDRTGNPVDLSQWLADPESDSSASVSTSPPAGTVKLRIKEWLGVGSSSTSRFMDAWGEAVDPDTGVVRVQLSPTMVENAGIYEMNWAILDEVGRAVCIDRGILSIEKSLFPLSEATMIKDLGPPTIQEVRMRLMDSMGSENLLLQDIEFKDEQILLAMSEPVRLWNESPPPIGLYTTRTFPFRGAWISGVLAQLHMTAATHYRRNRLAHAAGGIAVDDKNKEQEYLREGQRLWDEYRNWLLTKKVEINLKSFSGSFLSSYSRGGW